MLGEIHEYDQYGEVPAGFDEMRRMYRVSAIESRDGMKCARTGHSFAAQHLQNPVTLIGFIQVDRHLHGDIHIRAFLLQNPGQRGSEDHSDEADAIRCEDIPKRKR